MKQSRTTRIRRSVAFPRKRLEEAIWAAPHELRDNLNCLVNVSLKEFVARRKAAAFEEAIVRMAGDPVIRQESVQIAGEFESAAFDGLR